MTVFNKWSVSCLRKHSWIWVPCIEWLRENNSLSSMRSTHKQPCLSREDWWMKQKGSEIGKGKQLNFSGSMVGGQVTEARLCGTLVGVQVKTVVQHSEMRDRAQRKGMKAKGYWYKTETFPVEIIQLYQLVHQSAAAHLKRRCDL